MVPIPLFAPEVQRGEYRASLARAAVSRAMIALDGSAPCDQTIDVVSRRLVHLGHASEIELKWYVLVFERMSARALESLQIAGLQLS